MTEERFDQLLKEMREESVAPEQAAAARDRVWRQLAGSTSLACAEFRRNSTITSPAGSPNRAASWLRTTSDDAPNAAARSRIQAASAG